MFIKIILVLIICITVSGCGTFWALNEFNLNGNSICKNIEYYDYSFIYSGVVSDSKLLACPITCHGEECLGCYGYYPVIFPGCLIDIPISFVADTVLLPYTVYQSAGCK